MAEEVKTIPTESDKLTLDEEKNAAESTLDENELDDSNDDEKPSTKVDYTNDSAGIMMVDGDEAGTEPLTPLAPVVPEADKKNVRREGVTEATNAALVIIKRKKKISIMIPEIERDANRRLNRVYLSSKKYRHLLDEMIGGVYGASSRPELELQKFEFMCELPGEGGDEASGVSRLLEIELVYDFEKNLYVISRRVEDKLLLYLHQNRHRPLIDVDPLKSSTNCEGLSDPVSHLDLYRQRMWRRLLGLYVAPLLTDPLRINYAVTFMRNLIRSNEEEALTPEGSEDGGWEFSSSSDESSDDGEREKKKGKGKKKTGGAAGKGGAGHSKQAGGAGKKVVSKSKSIKKSKSLKKSKSKTGAT